MIEEARRRAYLGAMQVASWLPRVVLPFAAPSRPELLETPAPVVAEPIAPASVAVAREAVAPVAAPAPAAPAMPAEPGSIAARLLPKVGAAAKPAGAVKAEDPAEAEAEPAVRAPIAPPPRFALQLLRAGECTVLVELPTGEPLASRDPAYLLLKDLLRAAGLPDSPLQVGDGEPIRWPLLVRGGMDQGPEAARDYVQGVLAGELEQGGRCTWLIGTPALRFAGEVDETAYNREVQVDGLGVLWALPGLELLIDEPARKGELWKAMRRLMPHWLSQPE